MADCEREQLFSITVFPQLSIICNNPPVGIPGVFYQHAFPVTGGVPPLVWSISDGSLPPGLTLNPDTGVLSGIPTLKGVYEFTVTITDANENSASVTCSIKIRVCLLVE